MIERYEGGRQTKLTQYALLVPNMVKLIARLLRDPRVPARNKATLVFVGAYLVSPIDLIPSFVVGLGQLDDIVLAALALNQLLHDVPDHVLHQHWDGDQDVLDVVREVLEVSTSIVPGRVKRLFSSR